MKLFAKAGRVSLLLIFTLLLVSCGAATAPGGGTPSGSGATDAPVEIQFFYPVAVAGPISQIIDSYIADFQAENPNIKVTPVLSGGYVDTLTKIQTTIQGGGEPPDVAVLLSSDIYTLIDTDAIVPLDSLMGESKQAVLDDFFPAFLRNSQHDGQTWGIPFQRSTPILYYNKDLFREVGLDPEQPPTTWEELADACVKLTERDSAGNVTRWGLEIPSDGIPYWIFQSFPIQAGQNLVSENPSEVFFNTPAMVEGLQFVIDLAEKHECMPPGVLQWATAPNDFAGGTTAMIYHTTGSLENLRKTSPFEVGTAFLPGDEGFGVPTGGGNLYIFKQSSPERQAAAWKFIEFLTSPERAADWSMRTGYVAVRKSAYEQPAMVDYLKQVPQAAIARDQLEHAQKELSTHSSAEIQKILGNNIQAALTGQKPPEAAMKDAQAEADSVLSQFK